MYPKELGGAVFAMPPTGAAVWPAVVDEIIGDERIQKFEQCRGAGGRKVEIHTPRNYRWKSNLPATIPNSAISDALRFSQTSYKNFRNTLFKAKGSKPS